MIANADRIDVRNFPPVEENIERPDTLSQGLLAKHNLCPRSAYLARKFKGGPGSLEMDRGICLHDAWERCQNIVIEEGERTIPAELARAEAEAVMAERPDLVLSAQEQDRIRGMVWNLAESSYGTIDPDTILGIEIPLELELAGFRLTCRADRVERKDDQLYIYDWKSGFPGKKEDTEESFQGQFYAMALLYGLNQKDPSISYGAGINHVWFYEVFPREVSDETGEPWVMEAEWSREEIYEFKTSIERNVAVFAKSLETGDWPARDDEKWCGYCPAPQECPIPEHLRSVDRAPETLDEARDALTHKIALEREGRRIQAGLRAFHEEHGDFAIGSTIFTATPSESKSVKDWEGLQEAIAKTGPGEIVDDTPFVERKKSTRYGHRQMKKEEKEIHGAG